MSRAVSPDTTGVVLVLADVSGYTRFMTTHENKSLRHSQMIVGELLETLLEQIDVPLKVSNIEGDALFLYAERAADDAVWSRRSRNLITRLLDLFRVFHERLVEIGAYSVCRCEACANVGDLELKLIIHSGEALVTQIGPYATLSGVDVITLHRLAKNSIRGDRYVLMTEAAVQDLGLPADVEVLEGSEQYDTGEIRTRWFVPRVAIDVDAESLRNTFSEASIGVRILRDEIQREYTDVAADPGRGYHFRTGREAATGMGYPAEWFDGLPDDVVASFAGTGNPFSLGDLHRGDYVVDIGSGAGLDALIAARLVGPEGHVIGVDMTDAMLAKARSATEDLGLDNLEFREGYAETLPVPDGWADVVISNGVINLSPAKDRVFAEIFRVLRPGGRVQIGDITVDREVPEEARRDIDLWTN